MTDWLSGHPAAWEEGGASYGFSLSAPAPRPEVDKKPGEDSIQLKMAGKSQGNSLQFEFAFKRDSLFRHG